MKMPFGKHKGRSLEDVPDDYLLWIVDSCKNVSPTLLQAIKVRLEIEPKEQPAKGKGKQHRDNQDIKEVVEKTKVELQQTKSELRNVHDELNEVKRRHAEREAIITKWFRQATWQFHPDRGGSHEVQVLLNALRDALKSC